MSHYGSNFIDRAHAADMVASIQHSYDAQAAALAKKQQKQQAQAASADAASVRSTGTFSSTVGLLKDKVRRSSKKSSSSSSSKQAKDQRKILRSQVNIVG